MNAIFAHPERRKVKLRADDYLMLSDAGAFDHLGRTELIEGEIWTMNAIHSWHAKTMIDLATELSIILRQGTSGLIVYGGGSVRMTDDSVPEPDIFVGEANDRGVLPIEKLRLAVEISDSTESIDLGVKRELYARAGVPEYWVVTRDGARIHQFWMPENGAFANEKVIAFGARIDAATLADLGAETAHFSR